MNIYNQKQNNDKLCNMSKENLVKDNRRRKGNIYNKL